MFFYRWLVTIRMRSLLDRSEIRWCLCHIHATTPQRAAGHRSVWEARSRLVENATEGDWFLETEVVRDIDGERNAKATASKNGSDTKASRRALLFEM